MPKGRLAILAGLLLVGMGAAASAAELRDIKVDREGDFYTLRSVAWFGVPDEPLYSVLTNYDLFRHFTSAIVESENLEPDDEGHPRYFTRMEGCVLWFCKSFVRVGHLELKPDTEIVAIADPELSDFKQSDERWTLEPKKDGTVLVYEFEMVPDFWVPPIIGPYLIQRALRSGGGDAIDRIEALAIAQYER